VDLDLPDVVLQVDVRAEPAQHASHPSFRLRERERAELGAGTGDAAALERVRLWRVGLQQRFAQQVVERPVGHVRDDRILAAGEPHLAGAVLVGQVGEFDRLLGGDPADLPAWIGRPAL
jgi:hypothetical protein